MADFTERLDQIVGGLAIVFDDQQAHLRGSCGHGNRLSLTMARPPCTCKATAGSLDHVKKAGGEAGGPHRPLALPTEGGVFRRKVARGSEFWTRSPEGDVGGGDRCRRNPPSDI
jgi:hypothetical protein